MRRLNAHGSWDIRDSDNEDARILSLVHSIEHNETVFECCSKCNLLVLSWARV